MADNVMTVKEVAAWLRINSSTMYRMIKKNGMPHFKIGSDYRFNRERVEEWMNAGGNPK